jgi:hypothetical protein
MRPHERFEWDPTKARDNLRNHHVSFDDAAAVLADERGSDQHVEEFDAAHSRAEERWITTGSHPADRSIVPRIAWTERADAAGLVTRIITARPATARERRLHEDDIARAT